MDPAEADWNDWGIDDPGDANSLLESFQKQEDTGSVVSGEGGKSDTMYDSSNIEGEDSNFQFDNYESLEEMSESLSDDEDDEFTHSTTGSLEKSPYRFMNGNDGMATCERCGAVGIKHAFYSKSKRFCSLACSRLVTSDGEHEILKPIRTTKKPVSMKKQKSGKFIRRNKQSKYMQGVVRTFDWGTYIAGSRAEGAPVSCFRHVPMSDSWDNISVGMKVEVQNQDCDLPNTVYWIATVMKIAGYKALLRYEGFGSDSHMDYWINLCSKEIHPVGWCATSGKPLVPPKTIQHKYQDWKDYLVKRLTGSRTLPSNFYGKVQDGINNHKFKKGVHVEVVNRMCVSAMRVATVEEVIGGRLRLHYDDAKEEGDEFWCHMKSALLHPVGWAQQAGHKLHSTQEYRDKCLGKITMQKYEANDATPEMFAKMKVPPEGYKFQVGMKLEAIDPLNLSAVCVATVMKVLKHNYLMIGIDGSIAQNGSDWFCYHATSPCIFPVGFCEVNGLTLTPPRGFKLPFKWFDYLKQTRSTAAPVKLFDKEIPKHGFKSGVKLEAVDLMEPRLICVATVAKVVGRLLRVHFDGWESEYDQWVDCESPDLYPIGWCELMNYNVEGPRLKTEVPGAPLIPQTNHHTKKRKGKTQIYKGPRKKRKPKTPLTPPPTIKSMSDQFDMMRHRLLNTRTEEVSERAQEVPQASDLAPLDPHMSDLVLRDHTLHVEGTPTLQPPAPPSSQPPSQSALLEQIKAATPQSLQSNLLAGHLTGTLPFNVRNSPLVSTTTAGPVVQPQALSKPPVYTSSQPVVPETQTLYLTARQQSLAPEAWSVIDVCHFLKYNDCSAYVELFHRKNITGDQFIVLSREQIVSLTGMKVGSSLKIYDLIQVLKNKMSVHKLHTTAAS